MELVLQQKQTLNLVMTAELRQAINLLQYSTYDLYQYIQEQQAENPLIEIADDYQDTYTNYSTNRTINDEDNTIPDPLMFVSNDETTLYDELLQQVNFLSLTDGQRNLVNYFIQNIDENGYLQINEEKLAEQLNISVDDIDAAIKIVQQLEPAGVGARNLAECLTIQAERQFADDDLLISLVKNHLTELANRQWEMLSERYDVPLQEIQRVFSLIQTLDPKPGTTLTSEQAKYVEPDVIITYDNGQFSVRLNDAYIPDIRLNKDYLPYLNKESEMSTYIKSQYKKFYWLKKSIEQRRKTILKITQVIIKRQLHFFEHGFAGLQPLTLKDVAEEINMHESTVSRATMNKMIQTPKGTFNMRRLFSTSLNRSDGSMTSQTKVKLLLQDVVDNEDKTKPLSDQKIADYLKTEKDIKITRRTVTKYREQLNIPSSRQRREVVFAKN